MLAACASRRDERFLFIRAMQQRDASHGRPTSRIASCIRRARRTIRASPRIAALRSRLADEVALART